MLKRILVVVVLFLFQLGCSFSTEPYEPADMTQDARLEVETLKRDFLKIEDLVLGDGPVAAWNRRIEAVLDVRYADGTVVFQGPIFYYVGFATMPDGGAYDGRHLNSRQRGIRLGINGMTVGGRRRITVAPQLTCAKEGRDPDPKYSCDLVGPGNFGPRTRVRQEPLIVEVELTESCIPIKLKPPSGPCSGTMERSSAETNPLPKSIPPPPPGVCIRLVQYCCATASDSTIPLCESGASPSVEIPTASVCNATPVGPSLILSSQTRA